MLQAQGKESRGQNFFPGRETRPPPGVEVKRRPREAKASEGSEVVAQDEGEEQDSKNWNGLSATQGRGGVRNPFTPSEHSER